MSHDFYSYKSNILMEITKYSNTQSVKVKIVMQNEQLKYIHYLIYNPFITNEVFMYFKTYLLCFSPIFGFNISNAGILKLLVRELFNLNRKYNHSKLRRQTSTRFSVMTCNNTHINSQVDKPQVLGETFLFISTRSIIQKISPYFRNTMYAYWPKHV